MVMDPNNVMIGRTYMCLVKKSTNMPFHISKPKLGSSPMFDMLLQMLHHRHAIATQVLLCKSNR